MQKNPLNGVCEMASKRISGLKIFFSSVNSAARFDLGPSVAYTSKCYHTRESTNLQRFDQNRFHRLLQNPGFQGSVSFAGINPSITHRLFSSSASEAKVSIPRSTDSGLNGSNGGSGGDDWIEKFKEVMQSSIEKAKEASNEAAPHIQQWLDTQLHRGELIVPVGGTLAGTLLVWFLLPRLFKQFHKYLARGQSALLAESSWGRSWWGPVPYEESCWGALEVPVRYCITSIAFLEIATMVAPSVIASQYVAQAWKGTLVISLFWFLYRWKTNVINRALAARTIERNHLLTLENASTVGIFAVGLMVLAEACGVAVQSILTVGGVGGVATAFACKDILGSVLSGLDVQNSKRFSMGDTIKVGNEVGEVVKMDLRTTSLVTSEGFAVTIPNSMFSTQLLVNKTPADCCSIVRKIRLQTDDMDKISQISENIKSALRSNPNVFLEKEAPYCILSYIEEGSHSELTVGWNLKKMDKDAVHNIFLEVGRIIKQ
ncbi:hypothetical protein ABFS82_02G167000 [Erythranthe guttata]|uniref:Mechanosensitive ion channel MscS domain-containing protein n=2 Tax=Erythranthe guttata TaxID=4155 RepID=A0A022QTZ4_ERYGU|nr:PREDICTED: mechanosensitive ion channel protein 1, mitochondrial-like isoform X1 [Erythranthe guttata]EYU32162.1 hypothetical protein MIMGU_mgv1a005358mg [Erythranthe guttata]|eukprot:XP_012843771.1 PREDICTED: mechanosensitive ion channel protein 1, mitochondrial-like isoform X1 [Erythranthe guttata]